MCMRLTNVGSQYLVANVDAHRRPGRRRARPTGSRLPKDIPAARFWSLTVYDNQTRSMLQTDQRYPRAGSQSYPSPAAEAGPDGTTVVYFAPTQPDDVADGNWIQTDPDRAGSSSCASTARSSPSSTRPGAPARSSRSTDLAGPFIHPNPTESTSSTRPNPKGKSHVPDTATESDTPVLDLLARMTADSVETSSLDAQTHHARSDRRARGQRRSGRLVRAESRGRRRGGLDPTTSAACSRRSRPS